MEVSSNTPAVVTGGASGLGEATARAIAAKGAKVAIFDMNEEKGEAVAKDIGGIFCKVNVTSDEDVDAGFAKAREAHGQERECDGGGGGEDDAPDAGGGVDDGLIGGYLGAALFVVSADQKYGVVGSRAEQDRSHEGDGELGDGHAHLAER